MIFVETKNLPPKMDSRKQVYGISFFKEVSVEIGKRQLN